jgi:hypothetical protein
MTAHRPITLPPNATPIAIADQPAPMLEWVEIARMVIDDSYQRPIMVNGWKTIRKIAENFSWSCFTPVQIAPTQDGRFAVIDGQHRVHAALMCGLERVPAMIVPIAVTEQAKAFIQVNTARTGVSQFNLYKAGLEAGHVWAVDAQEAVAQAGCKLMSFHPSSKNKRPGEIYAVGLIRDMVGKGHASAVTVALTALRAIEDTVGGAAVVLYSDFVINPLIKAVADFPDIDADTLTEILRKRRLMVVIDKAHALAKAEHKSPSATARQAIALMIRQHGTAVAA